MRYLEPGHGLWHPFAEAGGWIAPNADLEFDRTYMNGAGTDRMDIAKARFAWSFGLTGGFDATAITVEVAWR